MLFAGAAGWLWVPPRPAGRSRLRRVGAPPGSSPPGAASIGLRRITRPPDRTLARVPALGTAAAAALVLLGAPGAGAVALGAAMAVGLPSRHRQAAARVRRMRLTRDLPRVADLVATCLEAGASPTDALGVVSEHVDGEAADALRPVASALRAGADPAAAWALVPGGPEAALSRLARVFVRAASTGAPLAPSLSAYADDARAVLRRHAEADARRAGVRAVAPLGLCFLPAFVLLGVVPVVAGVAGQVLGGLR